MIARTVVAGAAAFTLVGTASAAMLVVDAEPTLANVVVEVPACGEVTAAGVSVTWTPERICAAVPDEVVVTEQGSDSFVLEQAAPDDPVPAGNVPADTPVASESDPAPSEAPKLTPEPSPSAAGPTPTPEPDAPAVEPTGDASAPADGATTDTTPDARSADV